MADAIGTGTAQASAKQWWGRRRLRYNIVLLVGGALAFACFLLLESWAYSMFRTPTPARAKPLAGLLPEILVYLALVAAANLCYLLGPLVERIVPALHVDRYRRITFRLGAWLAALAPFAIPAPLACFLLMSALLGQGRPVRLADLPGTYVADYGVATDTLTLAENGRFVQIVKVKASGKVAVARGTWELNADRHRPYIFSEEMMDVVDYRGRLIPHFERPRKNALAVFNVRWRLGRLEIGGDDFPWGRQGIQIPHTKQPSAGGNSQ